MRIGTANSVETALDQLYKRQSELTTLQEQLSSGKKINRASDDPTGAAQAERALTKLSRIATDQRALETRRNAISSAESSLKDAIGLVQNIRELVVSAGNASHTAKDRATLGQQMAAARDQLLTLANARDSNGVPLFGGLGSAGAPFADLSTGVLFQGTAGQRASTATALPGTMNGQAVWMNVSSGNGSFKVGLNAANTGTAWTDPGTVISPAALTGHNYSISFNVVAGATTYDVLDTTTSATVVSAQPYKDGAPIQFDGLSVIVHGVPQSGDAVDVAPSTQIGVFKAIDDTIASIANAPGDNKLAQAVSLSLAQIDSSLERLQSARGQAGDWLNRADSITSTQEASTIAARADKSRAEDLDLVKGLSDFNLSQTGYQAALQSYAQIQKLSLFNYIN